MDQDRALALIEEAAASTSSSSPSATTTDAALALAWVQGQQSNHSGLSARLVARLSRPLASLVSGQGLAAASAAVRANAAGAVAALAATAEGEGDSGALALDGAAAQTLARVIADAAICGDGDGSSVIPRPLLLNALAALAALAPVAAEARRLCLEDALPALLAVALGGGGEASATAVTGQGSSHDLEVREAAVDALCAALSAGCTGAAGAPRAALVEAEAAAVAARVLILAGAAAEDEEEKEVERRAAAEQHQATTAKGSKAAPPPPPPRTAAPATTSGPQEETAATELRMRCLLLLGMLCGGGGGGGGGEEANDAAVRRRALAQLAQEPGAIAALLAAMRLGSADPPAAGVARALLTALRRDPELAPAVEAGVREAVAAAVGAAAVA
jgi:hypothetical protein